jgi:hypothetical protein
MKKFSILLVCLSFVSTSAFAHIQVLAPDDPSYYEEAAVQSMWAKAKFVCKKTGLVKPGGLVFYRCPGRIWDTVKNRIDGTGTLFLRQVAYGADGFELDNHIKAVRENQDFLIPVTGPYPESKEVSIDFKVFFINNI